MNWHHRTTSSDQGMVYVEGTGELIAITYSPKYAPLVASAPDLIETLRMIAEMSNDKEAKRAARDAISRAMADNTIEKE